MLVRINNVLSPDQVRQYRQALQKAAWKDGRATAGHQSTKVKQNTQLAVEDPLTVHLGGMLLDSLAKHPQFIAAALPLKVFPPLFNRYAGGGQYGNHIDSAVLSVPGTPHRVRTDISGTLFLSEPDEYDGGELVIEDTYGTQQIKLPAGHLVLYPGTSLHRVTPVTRGSRLASFFWVQSLVRDDGQRSLLWQLDNAIQQLSLQVPNSPQLEQLTGVYHNLVRQWSNT